MKLSDNWIQRRYPTYQDQTRYQDQPRYEGGEFLTSLVLEMVKPLSVQFVSQSVELSSAI